MFTTLEKELTARILLHKVAICKGAIAHQYMAEQKAQEIVLPDYYIQQNALEYANQIVQNAMAQGTLNEMYNKVWEDSVHHMPDDFCIMAQG